MAGGVLADSRWDQARGFRLRRARLRRGLSQRAAAERLGVNQTTVWRWEAGQPMSLEHLRQAARLYRVSQRWVLHGPDLDILHERVARLEAILLGPDSDLRELHDRVTQLEAVMYGPDGDFRELHDRVVRLTGELHNVTKRVVAIQRGLRFGEARSATG